MCFSFLGHGFLFATENASSRCKTGIGIQSACPNRWEQILTKCSFKASLVLISQYSDNKYFRSVSRWLVNWAKPYANSWMEKCQLRWVEKTLMMSRNCWETLSSWNSQPRWRSSDFDRVVSSKKIKIMVVKDCLKFPHLFTWDACGRKSWKFAVVLYAPWSHMAISHVTDIQNACFLLFRAKGNWEKLIQHTPHISSSNYCVLTLHSQKIVSSSALTASNLSLLWIKSIKSIKCYRTAMNPRILHLLLHFRFPQ